MIGHQFAYSAAPIRKVKEVQFGILSPEEIKAISVAKIEYPEVMDENTHKPKMGGLMDPRLGTIDRNFKCQTCGEGMAECPGHFGHIDLARAVFHPGFIIKVKKILECICVNCGRVKTSSKGDNTRSKAPLIRNPALRLKTVWASCKGKTVCETEETPAEGEDPDTEEPKVRRGGCGHIQPQIRKEGLKLFLVYKPVKEDKDDDAKSMQPERRAIAPSEIITTFKKITDEDLFLLGLSEAYARPEWMILTVLPVPPPPVRPSIAVDGGTMRSEDDLTYKLGEILKASSAVRKHEQEGAPAHVIAEHEQLLQFHVATYMDNDIAGIPQAMQKSGRPVKAIRARLKGKEGRLRGNLMGKRVDFSARTVITGDPNLELDEVGVPKSIAMNLTFPERVTPYNISYLQELVRNGPTTYPGARYVVRDTGERIDLRYNKRADAFLQYGWVVERHLKDGDFVLFNRQPSLHKMSMMSHRVRLMPYSTFRLNLSVTPPYNADFDGDEMNMHVPQSEETRAELSQIAWVPRQIVSPQANKPVMGIVQDTLCGIRKLTLRDAFLDWNQVQNILLWVPEWDGNVPPPAILKPKPLWTGKQIISLTIPRGINLARGSDSKTPNPVFDDGMLIENGELLYGIVDKKIVGASAGGLVHIVFREKGPEVTKQLFTGLQMIVNYWLFHHGFSIGIGDTIADAKTMEFITENINASKTKVLEVMQSAYLDQMKPKAGMTLRESFEREVESILNKARDTCGQHAQKHLKEDNNVKQMVVAGSKGSFINISQMSVCVGQQSVEGKRIPFGFRHRTLPHFTKDDFSPESRGFVENSYLRGLTPQEFFFHAMAGREGLIDTAVKTAETGYIQRRLVKALEDVMVCYDGTVRNSLGDLIQFVYGEDGMDAAFIEKQYIETYGLNDKEFDHRYRVDVMDPYGGFQANVLQVGVIDDDNSLELQAKLDEEYSRLVADRKLLRTFVFQRRDANVDFYLPVNLQRLIQNASQIFHIDRRKPSDLDPMYIIDSVHELGQRLIIVRGDDPLSREAQDNATMMFRMHLRSTFAARKVLEQYRLTKEAFEWVIGEVETKFNQSVAHPGEMCGTLAAQSIGEPATQMTLNTFHYAGVSSKNVTLGVPRLKEIINTAENIKTPSLTVHLNPGIAEVVELAKNVQQELAFTSLRTVTAAVEIWYDPDPRTTIIEEDEMFVESFFAIPDEEIEQKLPFQSPWLLRLVLDRSKMLDRKLTMHYVASKVAENFKADLFVIWSEDNSEKLIIRCRMLDNPDKEKSLDDDIFLRSLENNMMNKISLRGVERINRVFLTRANKVFVGTDGSIVNEKDGEWILETDGSNLKDVMCINGVDATRTFSNNCVEVMKVLGIEAARASLMKEMRAVIEFDGSYVNYRHLGLLCDVMTHRGHLTPITRHGINRADTGALMRCSFEETVEILLEAAAVGEKDDCQGVAENVLFGQMAFMGTGAFDVALDIDMLKDAIVDHRLPVQSMLAAQIDGAMTPGQVAITPYANNSPDWIQDEYFKGDSGVAAFSPLASNGVEDQPNFQYMSFAQSPHGAGGMSPGRVGMSPSSPNMYATSPGIVPRSPFAGSTSPFHSGNTSPLHPGYSQSMFGRNSGGYSPTNPGLGLSTSPQFTPTSPMMLSPDGYSPQSPGHVAKSPMYSPRNSPDGSPASPSFSPTSPQFSSPASPRVQFGNSPASPQYSPPSPNASPSEAGRPRHSPTSPLMSPDSPYSPASPAFSPHWGSPSQSSTNGAGRSHYQQSPSWDT
ncbi:RNA polymerase II large subunit [Coprinopsis marcescibilis]|uniref:DNA-directed RNA polymerase subunit n=1 Tax=Coprinopsis marcescibilis TaxID=230819 RepID=A0A5C3L738_COPMA|nr:RNA polymerase II large subunit [Coprinopsis marcescibilis]